MPTPEEQAQSMVNNLEEKTGRTIGAWLAVVEASDCEKHGEIVKMLKSDHGVTYGYANLIAHESRRSAAVHSEAPDLVEGQYAKKQSLRPIYDRIAAAVAGFGDDVELSPKKAYVSLRRAKQFALVQPSTKTRVDVGIKLKGAAPTDRLELAGSWNAMVSHRVRLTEEAEVDDQLIGWLREAYVAAS